MNTKLLPKVLVFDLIPRSTCRVQMAAVIRDKYDAIFSWGWNHAVNKSDGPHGVCAEEHAVMRANRSRLRSATITIGGIYRKGGNFLPSSRPCDSCARLLKKFGISRIEYITKSGEWQVTTL